MLEFVGGAEIIAAFDDGEGAVVPAGDGGECAGIDVMGLEDGGDGVFPDVDLFDAREEDDFVAVVVLLVLVEASSPSAGYSSRS